MKLSRKAFLALSVSLLPLSALPIATAHADSPKSITVALDNEAFPPFYSKAPNGEWKGWEIDWIHAVCKEMGAQCTYKPIAFDGLIPALQQKQVDVVWASLTISEDRQKVIDFTNVYYDSPIVFIGDKSDDTKVDCANMSSFKGKVVGTQSGSNYAEYLRKHVPTGSGVQVKSYDTVANMLADLDAGRIDYALEAKGTLSPFLNKNSEDFGVRATCPADPILGYGIGGGLRKGDAELKASLDKAIHTLIENGTWDKITAKYPGLDQEIVKPKQS